MTASKIVAAAASGVGGAGLDVDEIFSTYLYDGTGANLTITNGIDLSGEGGLVWIKSNQARSNALYDTERGVGKVLISNESAAQGNTTNALTAFNSNGFSLGIDDSDNVNKNYTGNRMAAWTFRQAPKFFDVVTFTGDGSSNQTISHNLGSVPGMIITKKTNGTQNWYTYHRGLNGGTNPEQYWIELDGTGAAQGPNANFWNNTAPTSTQFTAGSAFNGTYVAYLFAHNDGDGEFGPDSDQDIIKCGVYVGNGSATGPVPNLGFEPQWLIIKNTSTASGWYIFDVMRGITTGGPDEASRADPFVMANANDAEEASPRMSVTATGFNLDEQSNDTNSNNAVYMYMAIRRGSLAAPDDATKVFAMDRGTSATPSFLSGFPVDMGLFKLTTNSSSFRLSSRMTQGEYMETANNNAAQANNNYAYDYQSGFFTYGYNDQYYSWMWKRAPEYFDVVAYTGTGSVATINHNLGVVPEMMWIKRRSGSYDWVVYHKDIGATKAVFLNKDDAAETQSQWFNNTAPTSSVFTGGSVLTFSNNTHVAYLFATVAGVSKVGSYNGNGSSQTIDCGFSNGARFVLIKRYDGSGEWYVFDTERGINSGNDSILELNQASVVSASDDWIDPQSSGFSVTSHINQSSQSYIFYAIA